MPSQSQLMTINGTGRFPAAGSSFNGPFNLVTEAMNGSTIKLVRSRDDGATWVDVKVDDALVQVINRETSLPITNYADWLYALVCTTYGGTPFQAGIVRNVR
jgi:hypothetical protein